MERLIYDHTLDFLDSNGLLSKFQFGFRKGMATEDQLLLTYCEIVDHVDEGRWVDVVYLDFSKAFDVVCHELLLNKLVLMGFSARLVSWIRAFLCGRVMQVTVRDRNSVEKEVGSGVPQGSVLGPLLFLIYVNSLADQLECKYYVFADDLKLFISFPRTLGKSDCLQRDLNRVLRVSESWNLKLNAAKSAVMRFGSAVPSSLPGTGSGYFLGNSELFFVSAHKDLGITVDNSLKFHLHTANTARKASGLAGNLLRSTVCLSREFMVTLFVSHIRPILDYCSCLWNLGFEGDLSMLEGIQRRWTKQVDGLQSLNYHTRLINLGLYSIRGRFLRADLLKLWKIFHGHAPVELLSLLDRSSHGSTRGHDFKLAIPRCRRDLKRRFFHVRLVNIWNNLPREAVLLDTKAKFKHFLDTNMSTQFYRAGDDLDGGFVR